ncbi:ADP-ribosylation factor family-domain-containing protein [Crassisporium funariophilum]|nr:ADP-ribosylation factor family-domain-containing protein [Crassisporium funariophilum]
MISSLINRFYPTNDGPTVAIVGLDYTGKTTILYMLKVGEIVQSMSSMGANVETIACTTASGKQFKMTGWDIGSGCGSGGPHLYRLLRLYINISDAVIYVVDSCDRKRLPESVDTLRESLSLIDSDSARDSSTPNLKIPILILANKMDKPGAMSVDDIRIAFSKVTSGRIASVYKTAITKEGGVASSGLPEAFDWLMIALEMAKTGIDSSLPSVKSADAQLPNLRSASTLAQKLESWLNRIETDFPPDEFLSKFRSFTLPSWDHYTHIRIAYIILTKYGRKDGKDMLFKGLEQYIAVSPLTKGRSFHVSMTYFWIQIVHLGIRNMPPNLSLERTPLPSDSDAKPSLDDFSLFLLINPHVADGNLWSDYYTKDVLMAPKAKEEMVLPDKKPLPNLVARDAITTFGAK